jgi:hypothetical protein
VTHFDKRSFPKGTPATIGKSIFEATWIAADGTAIDRTNNAPDSQPASAQRFLVPGKRGALRVKNNLSNFQSGEQLLLIFRWVRRGKTETDLDALLTFDAPLLQTDAALGFPQVVKVRDANLLNTGKVDAIRFTANQSNTDTYTLGFTVLANAKSAYPDTHDGRHGWFWIEIMATGFTDISLAMDAADLR